MQTNFPPVTWYEAHKTTRLYELRRYLAGRRDLTRSRSRRMINDERSSFPNPRMRRSVDSSRSISYDFGTDQSCKEEVGHVCNGPLIGGKEYRYFQIPYTFIFCSPNSINWSCSYETYCRWNQSAITLSDGKLVYQSLDFSIIILSFFDIN